ncbi:MAG: ankyrin repeat domain-containing protein [Bacillota bacterium]|nr:ankyrin repeat domain-containing protein [Bacillota bacterium]
MKERKNKTALMNFFISHNQGDIVRYLIERGYDIYRGNPTKWYGSLSVAASRGNLEIFKYLFEETGKNDKKCHKIKLFCGIYYGTVDIVKYVIDNMDVDDEKYVKRIMETYCLGNETNGEKTRYMENAF